MRINRLSSVFAWTVGVCLWVTVSLAMGQAIYEAPMTVSMSLNSRNARTGGLLKAFTEKEMLSEIGAVGRTVVAVSDGSEFGAVRFVARGKLATDVDVGFGDRLVMEVLGSSRVGIVSAPAKVAPTKDVSLGTVTWTREVRLRVSVGLQGEAVVSGSLVVRARAFQAAGSLEVDWVPEGGATLRLTGYHDDGVVEMASTCAATLTFQGFAKSTRVPTVLQQPNPVYTAMGKAFSLSVVPSGTGPFTYQWFKDGVAVSGATKSVYAIGSAVSGSAGSYTVRVGNGFGTTLSSAAVVKVNAAPEILAHPAALSVATGAGIRLSVSAVGSGTLSYQWVRDGVPLEAATAKVFEISSASAGDAGMYSVIVGNAYGSVVSKSVRVFVSTGSGTNLPGPSANGHGTLVVPGLQVAFATRETSVGQWKAFLAAKPDGASEAWKNPFEDFVQPDTHPVVNVTWEEARRYCQWLTESSGRVWRLPLDVEWSVAAGAGTYPWTLPLSRRDKAGNYAEQNDGYGYTSPGGVFAANALGLYDMGGNVWEWMGDATSSGDTSRRIIRGGSFYVWDPEYMKTVTRASPLAAGAMWDVGFRVVCELSPTISALSPSGGTVSVAAGGTQDFSVTASSSLPVTYQWYKDGVLIPGATSSVYRVGSAGASSAGRYTVRVKSTGGVVESAGVQMAVTGLAFNGHEAVVIGGMTAGLARHETTVSQWRNFVAAKGWNKTAAWSGPVYEGTDMGQTDLHPVVNVSWDDAREYCEWLSSETGLVWRLPMESEWNVAAGVEEYPWGSVWPALSTFGNVNFTAAGVSAFPGGGVDGVRFTSPVGMFAAAKSGLRDLAGNVSEWVGDATFGGDAGLRVVKGSSWMTDSQAQAAVMFRAGAPRGTRSPAVGFRVAVELAPRIVEQPRGVWSASLKAEVLSVNARGYAGTLTYQWLLDGVAVKGATSMRYTVPSGKGGAYQVRVSNAYGSALSEVVAVSR